MFVAHFLKETSYKFYLSTRWALKLSYLELFRADESSYICENPKKTPKLKSINKESDTVSGGKIFSTNKKPSWRLDIRVFPHYSVLFNFKYFSTLALPQHLQGKGSSPPLHKLDLEQKTDNKLKICSTFHTPWSHDGFSLQRFPQKAHICVFIKLNKLPWWIKYINYTTRHCCGGGTLSV